jgi:hypothetical protein
MVFLEIFLFNFGSGIWHPTAPSTMFNRWILWKINFVWGHMAKISKGLRIWDEIFPPSLCIAFGSISLISTSVRGSMMNLLIYLADQLLWACQSADNQVQALQYQVTKGFSIHGSRLPDLEAEVVLIQPFVRLSLRYLISVDQRDLVLWGFLFLSFGPLADSSLFSFCFGL